MSFFKRNLITIIKIKKFQPITCQHKQYLSLSLSLSPRLPKSPPHRAQALNSVGMPCILVSCKFKMADSVEAAEVAEPVELREPKLSEESKKIR